MEAKVYANVVRMKWFWGLGDLGVSDFGKVIWVKEMFKCWVGKWNRKEREQSFPKKRRKRGTETKLG